MTTQESSRLLKKLQAELAKVDFGKALDELKQHNLAILLGTNVNQKTSLQIKCLAAEIYDYFGQYDEARKMIEPDGLKCRKNLDELVRNRDLREGQGELFQENRTLFKQWVIAVLQYGYVYYRNYKYAEALEQWEACQDALTKRIVDSAYPCHGTQARVFYAIGLAHRQIGYRNYGKAKRSFADAVDYAWFDVEDGLKDGTDIALSEYRIAKSLGLGLGWVAYAEGELHLAQPLIVAARTLLANKPERLIKGYVDVIHACVEMSAHSDDPAKLDTALESLDECYRLFQEMGHEEYRGRTAYELSRGHLKRAISGSDGTTDFEESRRLAIEVEGSAKQRDYARWRCNALIILSRIYRHQGRFDEALDAAKEALEHGKANDFTKVDALIALGEARFALGQKNDSSEDYVLAMQDFKNALDLGRNIPKIVMVCRLHLARTCARMGNFHDAFQHFANWKAIQTIENSFIRALGAEVEKEISTLQRDFLIPFATERLNPKADERRLHGFYYTWAMARIQPNETYKHAAALLHISPATLNKWRDEAGFPKHSPTKKATRGVRPSSQKKAAAGGTK